MTWHGTFCLFGTQMVMNFHGLITGNGGKPGTKLEYQQMTNLNT